MMKAGLKVIDKSRISASRFDPTMSLLYTLRPKS